MGSRLKNLGFFGETFQTQSQTKVADPTQLNPTQPEQQKFLTRTHH